MYIFRSLKRHKRHTPTSGNQNSWKIGGNPPDISDILTSIITNGTFPGLVFHIFMCQDVSSEMMSMFDGFSTMFAKHLTLSLLHRSCVKEMIFYKRGRGRGRLQSVYKTFDPSSAASKLCERNDTLTLK